MRWKRILIIGITAAALAVSLYAVSLAQAGIRTLQTSERARAAIDGVLHFQAAGL
jgi:CHASE3 domain sensor protein